MTPSDQFDQRLRRLMRDTAQLAGPAEPGRMLAASAGAAGNARQVRPTALRPLIAAGAVVLVLAVSFVAVQLYRTSTQESVRPAAPGSGSPTAAGTCPTAQPTGKVNGAVEPAGPFLDGTPTSITVCAYGTGQIPQWTIVMALDRVARVAELLDGLPPAPRGFRSCPFDDGSHYLLLVRMQNTEQLIVVERTGCRTASDGRHLRQANDELLGALNQQ